MQEASSTPTQETNLALERVVQVGGGINGITIVGDVAYVGMGPRVAAIDISQHDHPQLATQSEPLPGLVTHLLQITSGPTSLLLVSAGKYLVLVDTSSPNAIKPIFQLGLDGAVSALVWDSSASKIYAGVAYFQRPGKYTGIISSVDLTQGNQLNLISSVSMPEYPLSLALGVGGLFAGAEGELGGLYHIHMGNPGKLSQSHRVIASTPEEPLQPLYLQVIGDRLYLSYTSVEAYDITNPDSPVRIWSQRVSGSDIVKGFSVAGDQAYTFGWTILSEFVHGAITLPEPITGSSLGEIASLTAMHAGDFLVANNYLQIYDTRDPQDLKTIGTYQTPVINALDAAVNDTVIYVVDLGDGGSTTQPILQVLGLPELEPLGQVTTELPNGYNFCGMALEGDRLYVGRVDGLWAYGVENSVPVLLGKVGILDDELRAFTSVKINEKRLLFALQAAERTNDNLVRVYDVTDLQNPTVLGDPLPLSAGFGIRMIWSGSGLYGLQEYTQYSNPNKGMLYAIDYAGAGLALAGSVEIAGYTDQLAASNNIIMVAGIGSKMNGSFVSAINPQPLKLLSQANLPEQGIGLALVNNLALVAVGYQLDGIQNGSAMLLTYNVQDPVHPRQMEVIDIAASTNYRVPILITPANIILANGSGGLEVFNYRNPGK